MRPRVASTVSTAKDNLEGPLSTWVLGDAQLLLQAGVSESLAGAAAHGEMVRSTKSLVQGSRKAALL